MYRDRGHDPFLKAILERVEDDAPRLAYADWLGRRGDPRGEFIRIQCALDKLASDDPREADLVEREAALWRENGVEWIADLPDLNSLIRWERFHRGFPVCNLDLTDYEQTIINAIPYEFININLNRYDYNKIITPWSSQIINEKFEEIAWRVIGFMERLNPACMMLTARSTGSVYGLYPSNFIEYIIRTYSQYLLEINLEGRKISKDQISYLMDVSSFKTHLTFLNLNIGFDADSNGDDMLGDDAVEIIAGSPNASKLKMLSLMNWYITDEGAKFLIDSTYLDNIRTFIIPCHNEISKEYIDQLQIKFKKSLKFSDDFIF